MRKLNINIEDLAKMYPTENMEKMQKYFGVTRRALQAQASKYKIKRLTRDHRSNRDLTPLLSDDLQAFYWIGFIFADGCFHKTFLMVKLQETDKLFLDELASFIQTDTRLSKRNITNGGFLGQDSYVIQTSHKEVVDKLRHKFDFRSQKTYNPPDTSLWNFTEEQELALLIGFIDGDGSITRNDQFTNIDISNHLSWASFHIWIQNLLLKWTSCEKSSVISINKKQQSKLRVNQKTTFLLYNFILEKGLFCLWRKWNLIENHRKYKSFQLLTIKE